ncbi:tRNA wybutosine-synthesizing protein 4 [Talaromyces atroroseus]|uniref:tRNA wybutosine-synthesizing protein 4 n=1 Tax=Talaromyces atroroseus TaxID=1441469 RepID=A0A1Q5Q7U8_TALAT|nr:tRNA wybutosine-synthesizing protein 4 [Talaromyces atroroseus]OKL56224.1 tRNA wybutosine-synthesizing protein 4 [Talaromyces atroroseus]
MSSKKKQVRPVVPTKKEKEADLVMGTNNSSIVSKRSVELRYFPQNQFFRYFVKKPQRRAPLINRGYWLRMHAIAETVRQFLENSDTRPKFVLNLGCGYDPLAFQFLKSEESICKTVTFVDIDYEKLMGIKTSVIQQTDNLRSILGEIKTFPEPSPVLLQAPHYVAVGCDLKNLKKLEDALKEVLGSSPASVLCIAEVSLTYMDVQSADALISWIPKLDKDVQFCLLEQFFPDGPDHPFASTMMNHFHKLHAPLHSIHKYPTLRMQEQRFSSRGWKYASARTLWDIWNDNSFVSKSQRMNLDAIEPFDEWEEFALFASHYFVLSASTFGQERQHHDSVNESDIADYDDLPRTPLRLVSHHPTSFKGYRRFAAMVPDSADSIGVHGGLGTQSRLLSTDLYTRGNKLTKPACTLPPHHISARMCHTTTTLSQGGCLLVGGRASPTAGLADCWIRKDDVWKPACSLPYPRFRHCAARVKFDDEAESVLIYGGKSNKGDTLNDWLLWDENKGWQTVEFVGETDVPSRFGAQMVNIDSSSGYLFGGMSQDGVVRSDFWKWTLEKQPDGSKSIRLLDQSGKLRNASKLATYVGRFGASVNVVSNKLVIIGGIGVQGVLSEGLEILCLDITDLGRSEWRSSVVQIIKARTESPAFRPLLAGHVSCSVDSSSALVVSGGAVCFSFGTFWNRYIWQIQGVSSVGKSDEWDSLQVPENTGTNKVDHPSAKYSTNKGELNEIKSIPRLSIKTAADFEHIMNQAKPVVITGSDVGRCTELWSKQYLVQTLGFDRKVVVHEAQTDHMNFQKKNFSYTTKDFGTFMEEIHQGGRQYLRSISADQPAKKAANFAEDFPEIKNDFSLPPQLSFVQDNAHSSPLRISGPVTMWLHYDVMANVYCQIQGQKKLVLYPPTDVQYLELPPGASSSTLNIFDDIKEGQIVPVPHTSPHEATLSSGDILFIPPLWLHAAAPIEGVSVAVNVFFRSLDKGYAAGRDVYANRDLHAYEKGRQDVDKIVRSFDGIPPDMASFYLLRLANELKAKAWT